MNATLRSVLSVVAGFIAGSVIIAIVEWLSSVLFPLPPGIDPRDPAALRSIADAIPVGAKLLVLVAWFLGTFAGGFLACKLAVQSPVRIAVIVGILFFAAGLANMIMIPSPFWFWISGCVVFAAATLLTVFLTRGKTAA